MSLAKEIACTDEYRAAFEQCPMCGERPRIKHNPVYVPGCFPWIIACKCHGFEFRELHLDAIRDIWNNQPTVVATKVFMQEVGK